VTRRGVGLLTAVVPAVCTLLAWGFLVTSSATFREGVAEAGSGSGPGLVASLPAAEQERARAALAEADGALRASLVREIARANGDAAVPFLIGVLESDPDAGVRARAVNELGLRRGTRALIALTAAASRDANVDVSLAALEQLHAARLAEMVSALEQRLESASLTPAEREALERAHDHWLVASLGGMLPEFLREPPPVFAALPDQPAIRVLAFGDFGTGAEPQQRTARAIAQVHAQMPFQLGITLGDNFYPKGMKSPDDPRWQDQWSALYDPLQIAFYPSLGNHDWASFASPAAEVLFRSASWIMPAARYTFTAGPAQFFVLDTTVLSPRQLTWLQGELERSRAQWKIVYGHHPIRSGGRYGDDDRKIETLLPVLRGRADLYLAGHEHDMQYLEPEDGVHFAVIGSGGARIRPTQPGPRSLFCASRNGFGVLDIDATTLTLRFVDSELETLYETKLERTPDGVISQAGSPVARCLQPKSPWEQFDVEADAH
jgi:tartrate-resistant acid phosphatase type 5